MLLELPGALWSNKSCVTSREILDALHNLQTQEIQRKATCECDVVLTFHTRPRSRAPILRIIHRPVSESSSHTARNDWVSTCGHQLIIAQRVTESACLTKLMFHSNLLISKNRKLGPFSGRVAGPRHPLIRYRWIWPGHNLNHPIADQFGS